MEQMATKKDMEELLALVKAKVKQNTWSEQEERQMAMNICQENAHRKGISLKSYLEKEGVGKYKLVNLSDDESIIIDEDEVYKQKIVRNKTNDEIHPKVSRWGTVEKGDLF